MTLRINLRQPDSRYVHLSLLHGQISANDAATCVTASDVSTACAGLFPVSLDVLYITWHINKSTTAYLVLYVYE